MTNDTEIDASSTSQTSDPDASPLSLLDLPKELVWEIIGYVPEAAFKLRLVSQAIKCYMDEFAVQKRNIPVVEKVTFLGSEQGSYSQVDMEVSNLFALAHKLRGENLDNEKFTSTRACTCHGKDSVRRYYYWRREDAAYHDNAMDYLRAYLGKGVKKARLHGDDFTNFSKLLKGVPIDRLEVFFTELSDEKVSIIDKFVKEHKIDQITIDVSEVTITDPEKVLLELSSQFRVLDIYQSKVCEKVHKYACYFSGRLVSQIPEDQARASG